MVRRIGSFVALLLVAVLVLAACGSQDDEVEPTVTRVSVEGAPAPPSPTVPGEEEPATGAADTPDSETGDDGENVAGEAVTIDVEMVDIAFEPTEISVPANTEVTVNLVNNGVSAHTFTIEELGVDSGEYAAGQTGTVTFNSGEAGEYEFICTVPGHKEAGMVGKLIVTADASGDATPGAAASPAASAAASPAAAVAETTFDVEMVDIQFEPTEITVPANTEITINLINNGVAAHNFSIDELDVFSGDFAAGQTGSVTFKSGAPGKYQFYCGVPGHKEAGMVGTLIVQ